MVRPAPARSRPVVYAHIFYGKDAVAYRRDYLAGREPDETPYGLHLAEAEGFEVRFSRDAPRSRLVAALARRLPIDVLHAFTNRHRIRAADAVWTMTEGEAFAVAALMKLGIVPRRPMVGNAVWLLHCWDGMSPLTRFLYRRLAGTIDVMTVHSLRCLPRLQHVLPTLRSQHMDFGINTAMFPITPPRTRQGAGPLRLFAAGNDQTRDWDTLLAAFGNDDRFHLTVACHWLTDAALARYRNVSALRAPSMADFRRCYEDADLVVIPMKENIFSGITVALEAVALGRPVLASRTGGLPTYFEADDLLYVPPGDPASLRAAAAASTPETRRAQAERAQRRFLDRDYSTRAVAARYAVLTRELLGHPEPAPPQPILDHAIPA